MSQKFLTIFMKLQKCRFFNNLMNFLIGFWVFFENTQSLLFRISSSKRIFLWILGNFSKVTICHWFWFSWIFWPIFEYLSKMTKTHFSVDFDFVEVISGFIFSKIRTICPESIKWKMTLPGNFLTECFENLRPCSSKYCFSI